MVLQTPFFGKFMAEPMDYASAGVDIDLEGSAVASLIASLGGSTRKPGTPGALARKKWKCSGKTSRK